VIVGEFREDLPRVVLQIQGSRGQREIEFILDTAFDGGLTLPAGILQEIGAIPNTRIRSRLASGVEEYAVAATVAVRWHVGWAATEAIVYDNNPLLGTALLNGSHIDIEATEGGQVLIEPL
jgi:predicted aspartyl protease